MSRRFVKGGLRNQSSPQLMGQSQSRSGLGGTERGSRDSDSSSSSGESEHPLSLINRRSPAPSETSNSSSSSSTSSSASSSPSVSIRFSSDSEVSRRNEVPTRRVIIDLSSSSDESSSSDSDSSRMSTRSLRSSGRTASSSTVSSSPAGTVGAGFARRGRVGRPSGLSRFRRGSSVSASAGANIPREPSPPTSSRPSPLVPIPAILRPAEMATSGSRNNPAPPIVNQGINHNADLLNYSIQTVTFECIVCLENLDSPATLLENQVVGVNAAAADGPRVAQNPEGFEMVAAPGRGRGRPRGGAGLSRAAGRRLPVVWDPREIASTPCGHMYHRYCIEKWFTELGKKNCPSCRKTIPGGKMIRLYPNMGQDTGNRSLNGNNVVPQPVQQAAVAVPRVSPAAAAGGAPAAAAGGAPAAAAGGAPAAAAGGAPAAAAGGAPAAAAPASFNATFIQPRQVPNVNCDIPACADLKILHTTLVSDYNSLREQFNTMRYEMDVRSAEIESLQESHDRQRVELLELRASTGATNAKRRRQN